MDCDHLFSQTKPVRVFWLVTEGFVEEKTIKHARNKLFLGTAVIQQGHLEEQHFHADKKKLIHMVRFGANKKLSSKKGTYTDKDVDVTIAKEEKRRDQMQADLWTNT